MGTKEALKWIDERQTDILCLQEIKALQSQVPDDLFEKQYTDIIVNSASKKGYSGTMTWSVLQSDYNSNASDIDTMDEGRIVETHYNDTVLFNVYFPFSLIVFSSIISRIISGLTFPQLEHSFSEGLI